MTALAYFRLGLMDTPCGRGRAMQIQNRLSAWVPQRRGGSSEGAGPVGKPAPSQRHLVQPPQPAPDGESGSGARTWLGPQTLPCARRPHPTTHPPRKMLRSTISLALLLAVLQVSHGQRIKRLTACLSDQTLRIDCAYERKTTNPLSYEFRLSKGTGDGIVVAGNSNVASAPYKLRTNIITSNDLVCLYLNGFTTSDEGVYTCKLKITNDYEDMQSKNISVVKAQLARCAGISVFIQNTSWLLLLLLSLPLLQAVDFVSL
ncbi:thy-1 membrane glycoprotein [Protobothrops mucrosquamatus]|uniref:thy-1 membrane glycoprotein n=1 Tax=Protobothrops mucrosquamatus TaxID=103944 RepID=UPI0010FB784E|nr:thy-1 membrane glycoprotein [Protobothrops mucrosquamatus]